MDKKRGERLIEVGGSTPLLLNPPMSVLQPMTPQHAALGFDIHAEY